MNVALACDHAGFELKQLIAKDLTASGYTIIDLGAHDTAPSDYPDFARAVGKSLATGAANGESSSAGAALVRALPRTRSKGFGRGFVTTHIQRTRE